MLYAGCVNYFYIFVRNNNKVSSVKNISLHTVPYYGNERQEQKRRRKRWVDFVNPNVHTGNLRRPRILQLLYCQARLFAFVARCCVSYRGYLSLDPFFSIVAVHKIEG